MLSLDYNNSVLDAIVEVLEDDLSTSMQWQAVKKDWPESIDYIQAWDKPWVFVKCEDLDSEVSVMGTRTLHFDLALLLIYPITGTGDHFEEKNRNTERLDASIIETFFFFLDQHVEFRELLQSNIRDFSGVVHTDDISHTIKEMASKSKRRAIVFNITLIIDISLTSFTYPTFLDEVAQLKQ